MSWRRHTWRSDRKLHNAMGCTTWTQSHALFMMLPFSYSLLVPNVQVYNETLRDLLAPAGTGRNAPGRTLEHASIKHDTSGGHAKHIATPGIPVVKGSAIML